MKQQPTVFLCHSSRDKPLARALAQELGKAGIGVWIDEIELFIGDSLVDRIGRAIHETDLVLVFISSASVRSNWVRKELALSMTREITSGRVTVLPVLVDACQIPFFLRDKLYADFRDDERKDAETERIIRAIRAHLGSASGSAGCPPPTEGDCGGAVPGRTDLGRIVHDRGGQYLGYRCVRAHRRIGFAMWGQGIACALLAFAFDKPAAIAWAGLGLLAVVAASLMLLAASLFEAAYEHDKRLLIEIEAIGSYRIPFDKTWWRQLRAGRLNKQHQLALMCETSAILVSCVAIVVLLTALAMMV